jgi:hypothetical protein
MQRPEHAEANDMRLQRLRAAEIDVQCALAFSRTALRVLAMVSAEAAAAVEECLTSELTAVEMEGSWGAKTTGAILREMREQIRENGREIERVRALEDRLIREAMTVSCGASGAAKRG